MPMTILSGRTLAAVLLAALAVAACATDDAAARRDSVLAAAEEAYAASHRASASPDTTDSAAVAAPEPFTDNNILYRLAQEDRMEVQAAKLAAGKATDPSVRAFARQLADNHSAEESDARRLAARLKIPEKPASDDTVKAHQQAIAAQLAAAPKGLAFDTTYLRHLVDGHSAMLKEARELEKKAANDEVKKLIQAAIPELERHLGYARGLGKQLTAAKAP